MGTAVCSASGGRRVDAFVINAYPGVAMACACACSFGLRLRSSAQAVFGCLPSGIGRYNHTTHSRVAGVSLGGRDVHASVLLCAFQLDETGTRSPKLTPSSLTKRLLSLHYSSFSLDCEPLCFPCWRGAPRTIRKIETKVNSETVPYSIGLRPQHPQLSTPKGEMAARERHKSRLPASRWRPVAPTCALHPCSKDAYVCDMTMRTWYMRNLDLSKAPRLRTLNAHTSLTARPHTLALTLTVRRCATSQAACKMLP